MSFDFKALGQNLLGRSQEVLREWFPAGRMHGREFVVGGIDGQPGESLSINTATGVWQDFATGDKGADLISLYAAHRGVSQGDAYKALGGDMPLPPVAQRAALEPKRSKIGTPPADAARPTFRHAQFGEATATWTYKNGDGMVLGFISRHDPDGARKQFLPWSWDAEKSRWVNQALPEPRPLYGLDQLAKNPTKRVMLVEGEKAADAARVFCGHQYVVLSWPGGAQAVKKVDWSPLAGRKVLLWPDADAPGKAAMETIADLLADRVEEIKLLNPEGQPEGWDAADAVAEEWSWDKMKAWAKDRVKVWEPATTQEKAVAKAVKVSMTIADRNEIWTRLGLEMSGNGGPYTNLDNVCKVLERYEPLVGVIWYDEFKEKILTNWDEHVREWTDADDIRLTRTLQSVLGLAKVTVQTAHDAVVSVARQRVRNEAKEWLRSLQWDSEHRLGNLMIRGFGAEPTVYHQRVGECFMIGMVARAMSPGCKVDSMPVLEGSQGIGKSSGLRILGGPWFTECHESVMNKDFYGVLKGHLLVEISEMHAFGKVEVERIKGVLTNQVDRYRAPYGRNTEDHPRMSVFAGTTNRDDWQRDETGARRFWPVACTHVDSEWLSQNRDQLFAEAVYRYQAREPWWTVPQEEHSEQTELRRPVDTWEDALSRYLENKTEVDMQALLTHCLEIEIGKQDRVVQLRAASALRMLGWQQIVVKGLDRKSRRVWTKR